MGTDAFARRSHRLTIGQERASTHRTGSDLRSRTASAEPGAPAAAARESNPLFSRCAAGDCLDTATVQECLCEIGPRASVTIALIACRKKAFSCCSVTRVPFVEAAK